MEFKMKLEKIANISIGIMQNREEKKMDNLNTKYLI